MSEHSQPAKVVASTGPPEVESPCPVLLSWSGGKDCLLALERLRESSALQVVGLLTTFTRPFERVSMHGVRRELILAQADRLGLPLWEAWITHGAGNGEYAAEMHKTLAKVQQAVAADGKFEQPLQVAFGDLFLEDVRAYREQLLAPTGMQPRFPLWGEETGSLARRFIESGHRAVLCCVDTAQIPVDCCGRAYDRELLDLLPSSADTCGENGEFHTFVFDSPCFDAPISVATGQRREDGQFCFSDLSFAPRMTKQTGE